MTDTTIAQAEPILVAIDISKVRRAVLIAIPDKKRRCRLTERDKGRFHVAHTMHATPLKPLKMILHPSNPSSAHKIVPLPRWPRCWAYSGLLLSATSISVHFAHTPRTQRRAPSPENEDR